MHVYIYILYYTYIRIPKTSAPVPPWRLEGEEQCLRHLFELLDLEHRVRGVLMGFDINVNTGFASLQGLCYVEGTSTWHNMM